MSVTQVTVTSTQVAVRYRRNIGSLSIDMLANFQPKYRPSAGRDIGRYLSLYVA